MSRLVVGCHRPSEIGFGGCAKYPDVTLIAIVIAFLPPSVSGRGACRSPENNSGVRVWTRPLERQVRIMAHEGLRIDSQTLWDETEAVAQRLEPSWKAFLERILASEIVHADESWW